MKTIKQGKKKMADFILKRPDKWDLAYTFDKGNKDLCVLYLHGWLANRHRKKGLTARDVALDEGCSYLSLDYTAHGESGGDPTDFTIGQTIKDTLDVIKETIPNIPLIIIGNSVGGWIGLWLAEHLKQTAGFIGLAPAPDITEWVWNKMLPPYARAALDAGNIIGPSEATYGFCFTKELFKDGERHFMLNRPIEFKGPVRIIWGDSDDRVEKSRIDAIKDRLTSPDVKITVIKGADHHLSQERDLSILADTLKRMIKDIKK